MFMLIRNSKFSDIYFSINKKSILDILKYHLLAITNDHCCRTQLSDFTFTFHFHALEKEMATHPSVLALRVPGTGEPGGLLSMGLHRVRHE